MQATPPLSDLLVGAWTIESYETSDVTGENVDHPLGRDLRGLIVYTAEGYMSVQISAARRPGYADGALHGGTDAERAAAAAGYLAYTGTYVLDLDVVTHQPWASLFPNWEGQDVPRRARIVDDLLSLELLAPIRQGGHERLGTLKWRRARAL